MLTTSLILQVDDNKKLGEWVGLCKIDREGKPRKVVGCSCVVVKVSVVKYHAGGNAIVKGALPCQASAGACDS